MGLLPGGKARKEQAKILKLQREALEGSELSCPGTRSRQAAQRCGTPRVGAWRSGVRAESPS